MEKNGYIYILTNKSFNKSNLVKIGWSTDVEKRVRELSNTSVPLPFEIYATYEVPFDSKKPDKALHNLIRKLNPSLRITDNREFFEIEPWDAYELLESMAIIHNRMDKLVRYTNNEIGFDDNDNSDGTYTLEDLFPSKSEERKLFDVIVPFVEEATGKKAIIVPKKRYVAFKIDKSHNLISIWPKSGWIEVVLVTKLGTISDSSDTIYDISNRGWSKAHYAFRFDNSVDPQIALELIKKTAKSNK